MVESSAKVNLLGLGLRAMEAFFVELGEKPYRAHQALKWIHYYGATDFANITNFSKALRQRLAEKAYIEPPRITHQSTAPDGTHKWVLTLSDGNAIESVFIPEKTRGTLCVSSQVGCILNCDFCSTGKQGFSRNLTVDEIIGQVWLAVRHLSSHEGQHDHAITNVVMMGMGEPLLNFDNVVAAMELMLHDDCYGLSKRRVTLSTAGVLPALLRLRDVSDVALAISLHAPNNALRNRLVPLNKKYPLEALMQVCKDYFNDQTRRYVTLEYVMLDGINDQPEHLRELIALVRGMRAKVNLIPFNPFPYTLYRRSPAQVIAAFQKGLLDAGIHCITRKTRGEPIDAACGQLVGQVKDRTQRQARWQKGKKEALLSA